MFLELAVKHPPRIISQHQLLKVDVEEPDTINLTVACKCGEDDLHIVGIPDKELNLLCPISTVCPVCKVVHQIFDVKSDGYDGEYGHGCSYPEFEGTRERLQCTQCRSNQFKLTLSLSYQFEDLTDFEEIALELIPNYFDTFEIVLCCTECGRNSYVGEYECA